MADVVGVFDDPASKVDGDLQGEEGSFRSLPDFVRLTILPLPR